MSRWLPKNIQSFFHMVINEIILNSQNNSIFKYSIRSLNIFSLCQPYDRFPFNVSLSFFPTIKYCMSKSFIESNQPISFHLSDTNPCLSRKLHTYVWKLIVRICSFVPLHESYFGGSLFMHTHTHRHAKLHEVSKQIIYLLHSHAYAHTVYICVHFTPMPYKTQPCHGWRYSSKW